MLREVVVGDLHGQGNVLGAVGAAGADLRCKTLDAPRRTETALEDGLLEITAHRQVKIQLPC